MSGFTYPPIDPAFIYNGSLFGDSEILSLETADLRYMRNGSIDSTFLTGITPGSALPSKALILDSSRNITGIGTLGATNLQAGNVPFAFAPRLISALDSTMTAASTRFITLGRGYSSRDSAAITYSWAGTNSGSNYLSLGLFSVDNIILCNGNNRVGIGGLTNPAYTLDVNGISHGRSIFITPTTQAINGHVVAGSLWASTVNRFFGSRVIDTDAISLLSYSAGGTYNDYIIYDHNAGANKFNIQAQTTTIDGSDPASMVCFSVAGTIRANTNIDGLRISGSGGGSGSNRNGVGLDVVSITNVLITSSGSTYDRNSSSWNVFLSNTTYSLSARFSSAIWVGGSGILMTSDERLKKDIEPYESTLDAYKKLQICSYTWKETGNVDMGLIAQQTQICMPHLVRCAPDDSMDDGLIRSIDQSRLLFETVAALQLALKKIEALEQLCCSI